MPKGIGYGSTGKRAAKKAIERKRKAIAGGGGMHQMGPARKTPTLTDKIKKIGKGVVKEFSKNPRKAPLDRRRAKK
jgi:hypothetical protein